MDRKEPQLDADLHGVYGCWSQLMDGRQVGNGEALSWSEVSRWCEDHGIEGEARRRWCRLVKGLDRAYVAHVNTRQPDGDARTGGGRDAGRERLAAGRGGVGPGQDGGRGDG
jgi:hypothetical protein